ARSKRKVERSFMGFAPDSSDRLRARITLEPVATQAASTAQVEPAPEGRPRPIGRHVTLRVAGLTLLALLAAPTSASAQLFFATTPSPDLRIAPLTIRATVTPTPGPVPIRLLFSIAAPSGTTVPGLYLLWPGKVKGDPSLGPRDPAL